LSIWETEMALRTVDGASSVGMDGVDRRKLDGMTRVLLLLLTLLRINGLF
jgi:hypothetical protein